MSFQLQVSRGDVLQAIDISLGRQFALPVIVLVITIIGVSGLLENDRASIQPIPPVEGVINVENVDRLQRRLANLEGESQRLNEFAKKMVTLAKLDKDIFNFDKSPARGGLGEGTALHYTANSAAAVSRDIDALQKKLIGQSNRLERMQLALKSRILGESEQRSRWPVTTGYISSTFGLRKDPFTGRLRRHRGLDIAGPRGSDILSIAKGTVIFSGRKGGYGRVVEVKHINGVISRYAHLEASLVQKGQTVGVGEKIARLGTSGRSTGPHLHLEILHNNKNIDPLVFLGR